MHRRQFLVVDLLALGLFSVVGAFFHGGSPDLAVVVRTFLPLALSWLAVASWVGTYRDASWKTLALTWAVAVPAGVLLRQLVLGRLTSPGTWTFLLVGTAMGGVFLVTARLLVRLGRLVPAPRDRRP